MNEVDSRIYGKPHLKEGLIYKEFSKSLHVIEPFDHVSLAQKNPKRFILTEGIDPPHHWIRFLYDKQENILYVCDELKAPHSKDKIGRTPLHWAAQKGHTDIVQALIAKGADVNATVTDGICKGQTPLHRAAENGHTDVAELLIEAGANVNAKDRYDKTPLHLASKSATKVLKQNGAT